LWFSPHGDLLFVLCKSTSKQRVVEVLETVTGQLAYALRLGGSGPGDFPNTGRVENTALFRVRGPWLANDRKTLIVSPWPGQFRALDGGTLAILDPELTQGSNFSAAELAPDGQLLALAYEDGRLSLWKPPALPPRQLPT